MIEVPLRRKDGSVCAVALVDDEDAAMARAHRWSLDSKGYVRRGVRLPGGKHQRVALHRVVMGLEPGDSREVDHRDGNKLDNRRANLRIATHRQNGENRHGGNRGASSSHRGVAWSRGKGKWHAYARVAGRQHSLGYFDDEQEAAVAAATFRAANMPFSTEAA